MAGTELDKDGSSLMKFSRELPAKSTSPFILAVEVERYGSLIISLAEQMII
jgi:hypothetical protein